MCQQETLTGRSLSGAMIAGTVAVVAVRALLKGNQQQLITTAIWRTMRVVRVRPGLLSAVEPVWVINLLRAGQAVALGTAQH